MLDCELMIENPLVLQTTQYLRQALGADSMGLIASAAGTTGMPYFLQDTYEIVTGSLAGHSVALACLKQGPVQSPRQTARHVELIRGHLGMPVIVAMATIAAGERQQLIAQGVSFVVPGQQLFAPQLGLILSERFAAAPARNSQQVSPATQALLIGFLLQESNDSLWHPFQEAAVLGYAGMTATRAIRELLQLKLFELVTKGRAKHLRLTTTRRELWEKAKPHLHTPVQRTVYTYDRAVLQLAQTRLAAESALAQMSMLSAPERIVIAASGDTIQIAKQAGIRFEQQSLPDAVAVQIWRYPLTLHDTGLCVDPLSLWLSLRESADDRIQLALKEIEENFPW